MAQQARLDENQLAGHVGHFLKLPDGKIKKLVKDPEATFYKTLKDRNLPAEALEFIPQFYGIEEVDGKSAYTYSCFKTIISKQIKMGIALVSLQYSWLQLYYIFIATIHSNYH